jgi:ABC-2 type transport system permease protein
VGIILSAAILYDFLFRSSISFNMLFLEEIWSRNFTNLFVSPLKVSEIIVALTVTALLRTLIGIVPAVLIATPFFGVSLFNLGPSLILLFLSLYFFGITLGLLVTSGLLRYGPAFENIAWSSLFLLAPLGCIYYPLSILPDWLQILAMMLPLVHIFEEVRSILLNNVVNYSNIMTALTLNLFYFALAVFIFYSAFAGARKKGTLINIGE